MQEFDPKWYLLGVMILSLLIIVGPSWFHFSEYSDEESITICRDIVDQYKALVVENSADGQWEAFEGESLPRLKTLADDIETHINEESSAKQLVYQVARYKLPNVIQKRAHRKSRAMSQEIEGMLSVADTLRNGKKKSTTRTPTRGKHSGAAKRDFVVIAVLIFDLILALGGAFYWFRSR